MNNISKINALYGSIINSHSVTPIIVNPTVQRQEQRKLGFASVNACACSASCGSNYSQGGQCPCSNTCGSNYSH